MVLNFLTITPTTINSFADFPPVLKLMVLVPAILTLIVVAVALIGLIFRLSGVDIDDFADLFKRTWKGICRSFGRIVSVNGKYLATSESKKKVLKRS